MLEEINRRIVLQRWEEATERAQAALRAWRSRLAKWGDGGLVSSEDLQEALALLDQAGLSEFAEWGSGENLDELAEVLTGAERDD